MNLSSGPHTPTPQALAVIPARGGSRRIPEKNLADFCGVPALARVVEVVRESAIFGRTAVSTDDPSIADCAEKAGAEVIWRPAELADDNAPIQPVVAHAMETEPDADLVCLVLATAVLLQSVRLAEAYRILTQDSTLDYVIGIRGFESPPQRAMKRNSEGLVTMQSPETFNVRSQDFTPLYYDAGQFSFGRRAAWLSGQPSFNMRTHGMVLPRNEAVDIDEPEDLEFARLLFEAQAEK